MKIKEIHGNEISLVLSFPSHERAKLVLFYNPSAAATRRGESRSFIGSASRGARGKRDPERNGGRGGERERESGIEKERRRNPSGRLAGRRDGGGTAVN